MTSSTLAVCTLPITDSEFAIQCVDHGMTMHREKNESQLDSHATVSHMSPKLPLCESQADIDCKEGPALSDFLPKHGSTMPYLLA